MEGREGGGAWMLRRRHSLSGAASHAHARHARTSVEASVTIVGRESHRMLMPVMHACCGTDGRVRYGRPRVEGNSVTMVGRESRLMIMHWY